MWWDVVAMVTLAGRLMVSQSGDGNSSFPLRIWSNSSSWTLFSLRVTGEEEEWVHSEVTDLTAYTLMDDECQTDPLKPDWLGLLQSLLLLENELYFYKTLCWTVSLKTGSYPSWELNKNIQEKGSNPSLNPPGKGCVHWPSKRRKSTQQDVGDHSCRPDIHLQAVAVQEVHVSLIEVWIFDNSVYKSVPHPVSAMISGATYVGVPQTVYSGPSTTVAKPKSPNFNDLVPSGYSHTCSKKVNTWFKLTQLWEHPVLDQLLETLVWKTLLTMG